MAIHFIPNDPGAVADLPLRTITPRPERPTNLAHFDIAGAVAEGLYKEGTPEFLYWQCREGTLAALEAWEMIQGPFQSWHDDIVLTVQPDDNIQEDLNAYYDRPRQGVPERVAFFHQKVGNRVYFSGASTDVVAHEIGHALLDATRPDFWDTQRFEVNSFHEAFGDCIALVTALNDQVSRKKILPVLAGKNSVEATAEDLAEGIRKAFPGHNAGAARRARNQFQWGPKGSIPMMGGPGELIYEIHSFGQVFSGCFYDTIVNIFSGMTSQSEASLLTAAKTAASLLVKAVRQVPERAQFFREVGRYMVLIDEQENSAANRGAIQAAFQGHNIGLGASAVLAPQFALAAAPAAGTSRSAMAAAMSSRAKTALLNKIGATSRKLKIEAVEIGGKLLQEATHQREVPLDDIHAKLKGVVAMAAQTAFVGKTHEALTIMGHVSSPQNTDMDVEAFVKSLVANGQILLEARNRPGRRSLVAEAGEDGLPPDVTHEIREIRGKKVLTRVRYSCRGC